MKAGDVVTFEGDEYRVKGFHDEQGGTGYIDSSLHMHGSHIIVELKPMNSPHPVINAPLDEVEE